MERIDIVVHFGTVKRSLKLEELTKEDRDDVMNVNLKAMLFFYQADGR